jgi:Na+/H+-translocating membrane pyrophosphatase
VIALTQAVALTRRSLTLLLTPILVAVVVPLVIGLLVGSLAACGFLFRLVTR